MILLNSQIALVFAVASIFFVRGLTNFPFLQPVVFAILIIFLLYVYKPVFYLRLSILLSFIIFLIFLILYQYVFVGLKYGFANEIGRVLLPFIATFFMLLLFKKYVSNKKQFITKYIIYLTIFLFVDLVWRLLENGAIIPVNHRYELKVGGLIFIDSNFSGFIAACLFLFAYFNKLLDQRNLSFWLLLFIIVYSFSFSVYIAFILSVLFYLIYKAKALFIFFLPLFIFGLLILYHVISDDGSFLTKIVIFEFLVYEFLTSDLRTIFFGIGSGNFILYVGKASHSLFGLFAELGIVFGLVFILFTLFLMYYKELKPLMLFIVIAGFVSMFPIAYMTPVYFLIGVYLLELKNFRV